jgi:hypothetical protein
MISTKKLRKAMHDIAAKKGEFTLFALFLRADSSGGEWDLVVSAPWLETGKLKALGEFVELLAKSLGESNLRDFARVQTVGDDDPALNAIVSKFPVEDGELRVSRPGVFGLEIEDAIILRAKRPAQASAGAA